MENAIKKKHRLAVAQALAALADEHKLAAELTTQAAVAHELEDEAAAAVAIRELNPFVRPEPLLRAQAAALQAVNAYQDLLRRCEQSEGE